MLLFSRPRFTWLLLLVTLVFDRTATAGNSYSPTAAWPRVLSDVDLVDECLSELRCEASSTTGAAQNAYRVEEQSFASLTADMESGLISSEALVDVYLQRIQEVDKSGPTLGAVSSINPQAKRDARRLDEERARGQVRGSLHGIPLLVKDNIETKDPLPTTAGSLALLHNVGGRDARVVAQLREAGAVILGKTALSEWANARSSRSTSGWSGVNGQVRNPYALNRSPSGSSSGSGAGVAANLAAAAVGTETDGSIVFPASVQGLVGLKPTVELGHPLVSQQHIIPLAQSMDTAGPMARTVTDAAMLLDAMVDGGTSRRGYPPRGC
jgi:amidase